MKKGYAWLLLVYSLILLGGCGDRKETAVADSAVAVPNDISDLTDEARAWADSIYGIMTLEERLAQMVMPAVFSTSDPTSLEHIRWYAEDLKVGGLLLLKGDARSATVISDSLAAIRDRMPHSPGTFLAVDAETGLGMRFSDAPLFPWNSKIDRDVDEETFFEYGRELGREARITGINMTLGPVVDIDRSDGKDKGIMRLRSIGSDQARVADLSLAYARGLESQGVASVIKHFPGHGPTAADSHDVMPVITTSREELDSVDLLPFRIAIQNGLSCIMVGHIWAQNLDSVCRPASFSPVVITDLLRKEMGFKGLVIVDAVGMGGAKGYTGADAIIAGADIIIAPPDTRNELLLLAEAVKDGRLTESRVEETCKRILFYKYLRFVNTDRRDFSGSDSIKIEERLREEAPDIVNKLLSN